MMLARRVVPPRLHGRVPPLATPSIARVRASSTSSAALLADHQELGSARAHTSFFTAVLAASSRQSATVTAVVRSSNHIFLFACRCWPRYCPRPYVATVC